MKRATSRKPIVVKRLDRPDEERRFEKGLFRLVSLGGAEIGRAEYQPGWRWSEHVGPTAGTPSCEVEHVGLVLSGRVAVKMDDGEERVLGPGDVFYVPPGHDSWVVGDEPYVSLHLQGADKYAAPPAKPRRATARRNSPTARVARDLTATVDAEQPKLAAIGEDRAAEPLAAGKWSRKQVIGHLIDSAFNNQQRFVRAQLGASLSFPGYAQEEWVTAQAYPQRSWAELLTLWTALNRHLAHVIAHIDPRALETPCTIGSGAPVTLRFIAEDYVRHLRHHLTQVLTPDAAAGKTHPPYA